MALNRIWISFFVLALLTALVQIGVNDAYEWTDWNRYNIFNDITLSAFDLAKTGFELALDLTGMLALWLGLMKLAEAAGFIEKLARWVGPFFKRIFPDLPKDHPAIGTMILNFSANMLGLDNAATPMGLKAMQQLQEANLDKETASNAQIMFLVLNTSGLTLIPVSIMSYRLSGGAENPADVFLPILLTTFFSTITGLIVTSLVQKINLLNKVVLLYLGTASLVISGFIYFVTQMDKSALKPFSESFTGIILFLTMVTFVVGAAWKKVNVFETFIEGAKEGFQTAIRIIPYLVAMLSAIAIFRAAGTLDLIVGGIEWCYVAITSLFIDQPDTRFIDALPTALMKPLSGSGSRGLMVEAMNNFGVDSFAARLAGTFQGATDTTLYIIALYFGSVGIKNTRNAVSLGLIADGAGIIAGILIAYLFWG